MKSSVTLKDVAKKAGVGVGTASRVLNNEANVSQDKIERVLKVVNELDYKPNTLARNLRKQSTRTIGVIIQDVSNPFYSSILRGLQVEMVGKDYSFILSDLHSQEDSIQESIDTLVDKRVDALVFLGSCIDEKKLKQISKNKVPAVAISTAILTENFDIYKDFCSITIDNKKASYEAVNYLLKLGHTKIGFISGVEDDQNTTIPRTIGFKKALSEARLNINENWIINAGCSYKSGYEAMKQFLDTNMDALPTAIFCICDLTAMGATKALIEKGLSVPEDISLMGFDGIENAFYHNPSITTIEQPRYEMGQIGMQLLFNMLNKTPIVNHHMILDYKVIIGNSTAKRQR